MSGMDRVPSSRYLAGLLGLLAACGGGGGGGRGDAAATMDPRPPTVQVVFPGPRSQTEADSITVRGTASDPDGIAAVSVGDQPATSSDGFATWTAVVTLAPGINRFDVGVRDVRGHFTRRALRLGVENAPKLVEPEGSALDPSRGLLFVSDGSERRITVVDAAGGALRRFSDDQHGTGPALRAPGLMALDPVRDQLIVIDTDTVLRIDLDTGNRQVLAGAGTGNGPALVRPLLLTVDSARARAFVLDSQAGPQNSVAILSVDLLSGNRAVVSDSANPGPPLSLRQNGLALAPPGTALWLTDFDQGLVEVDVLTGDRRVLTDLTQGAGPEMNAPALIQAGSDGSFVFLTACDVAFEEALFRVDLISSERKLLAGLDRGTGPGFQFPTSLTVLDEAAERFVVVDFTAATVLTVDGTTGARESLVEDLSGDGVSLDQSEDLARDRGRQRILVAAGRAGVLAVDLASGDRSPLSDATRGAGIELFDVREIVVDDEHGRALVRDGRELIAVDLQTGDRTVFSGLSAGNGPQFNSPSEMALEPERGSLFVADAVSPQSRLLAVDLATGDRTIVSDEFRGTGPLLAFSRQCALDPGRDRALIADSAIGSSPRLLAVDLETGDRVIVSGPGMGGGPALGIATGLVVSPSGESAFVVQDQTGRDPVILEIDLTTGDRRIVVDVLQGAGPRFGRGFEIAAAGIEGQVFGLDTRLKALFLIDLETGDRVIVSK